MNDDRRRVALHESGHAFSAFSMGRPVLGLTIMPGRRWAGTAHYGLPQTHDRDWSRLDMDRPYSTWPAALRRSFETRAIFTAAGDAAEHALYWATNGTTRTPEPLAVQVADTTAGDRLRFAAAEATTEGMSDGAMLHHLGEAVFPDDDALRVAWLGWCAAQARSIVTAGAAQIERLADAALLHGRLGGRAIRTILANEGDPQ